MREIKFRGKTVNGNEWIYGYGVIIGDGFCAIPYIVRGNPYNWKLTTITCDINTLGQYTGLKDKNGKEIYEGDVVDVWNQGSHITNGIIKYGKGTCRFFIGNVQNSICWQLSGDENGMETLVVIGNIHDNPELIKEEEK